MTTGQQIKLARKNAKMTQSELAHKLNVPYQSISQWERDLRNPKIETLVRIASALNVPMSDLLPQEIETFDTPEDYEKAKKDVKQHDGDEIKISYGPGGAETSVEVIPSAKKRILSAYDLLNREGKEEAAKRIEELTVIPKYKRETE